MYEALNEPENFGWTALGEIAATTMGLPTPELLAGADQAILGQMMLLISLTLAGTLAVLSRNFSGGFISRWLTLSVLVWVGYGVNNTLEGAIFTSMSAASPYTVVLYFFASFLCGATVDWLFSPKVRGPHFVDSARNFVACQKWTT